MATGFLTGQGGVMAGTDVHGAGQDAWARVAGIPAYSSIVGGAGHPDDAYRLPYNVDRSRGRIVTTDSAARVPVGGSAANARHLDDWRDALNPGSPAFWLLLMALIAIGFMQFRVQTRVGRRKASLAVG